MTPFNQPIYVSSSANQSINQPSVAHLQAHASNSNIYVSTIPLAALTNSGSNTNVYVSQQQQQSSQPSVAPIYGQSSCNNISGSNSNFSNQLQFTQVPIPPPQILHNSGGGPPQAPPLPPINISNGTAPQTPIPPAPPMMQSVAINNSNNVPGPPNNASAPPPPPPLPIGGLMGRSEGMDMSSLASQLQQAKLKRNTKNSPPPLAENSGSSTSSGGSGNYGTIGRSSNGMASMMDEMAKTLARRRAQAEKKPEVCTDLLYSIIS